MIITCDKCKTTMRVADEKLPQDKPKALVKCPACGHNILFDVRKDKARTQLDETAADNDLPTEAAGEKTEVNMAPLNKSAFRRAKLICLSDQRAFELKVGKNVIGRSKEADFAIDDTKVSRLHCYIEVQARAEGMLYILTDDGNLTGKPSTNGTFLNEKRLSEFDKPYLEHKDKIRVGRTELIFTLI